MALVKTNIPGLKVREVIDESRRVQKHQDKNFALLNDSMALVTFDATHATEVSIKNPFGDRGAPIGFKVLNVTGDLGVASHVMRTARLTEDNRIGMTVQFEPPPYAIRVRKSTDQTGIASSVGTIITWDVTVFTIGGGIPFTGGTFTAPVAGIIEGTAVVGANATGVAAGDAWGVAIADATLVDRYAETRIGVPTTSRPIGVAAGKFEVVAGQQFAVWLSQFNAAAATKDVESGTGLASTHAEFAYSDPPPSYSATITGILYGPNSNIVDVNG